MSNDEMFFGNGAVRAEVRSGLGRLSLSRPKKANALSSKTLEGLIDAADWLQRSRDLRVVVLSGDGTNFSAGADLASFTEASQEARRHVADLGRKAAVALESLDAITIAAIQGWCVGGALVLVLACDLRVATDSARFSIPEIDLGIPLAWSGVPRLVREVGRARALELILTCRPFDSEEGYALGLLSRVVPSDDLQDSVAELASMIARKPRFCVRATKTQINAAAESAISTSDSWRDADCLLTALSDAEGQKARSAYVVKRS